PHSVAFYPSAIYSLSHLFPFLSFSSSSHHLYLHSFPTRRSSDLVVLVLHVTPILSNLLKPRVRNSKGYFLREKDRLAFRVLQSLDRKSTRLNSSHQIISYAVFCLKKKIK